VYISARRRAYRKPVYWVRGIRRQGGKSLGKAMAGNVGTWLRMTREKAKAAAPQAESTNAVDQGRMHS
jgi:hypothetical protein